MEDTRGGLPALRSGTMVGDFRVMRLVGRGGMGAVYLARDHRLGRRVALKFILPERLGAGDARERFLFEARTTARFAHPHIVTVYAVGEHEGAPWVAMEFLGGRTLRDRLSERPGTREAMRLTLAIAEALAEAHRHGVLHRDLKPENVLIPPDGRPRVVDFGLAKLLSRDPHPSSVPDLAGRPPTTPWGPPTGAPPRPADPDPGWWPDASVTPAGVDTDADLPGDPFVTLEDGLRGTRPYIAPEQYRSLPAGPASDVWALGVILHELVVGRRPYEGDEPSPATLAQRVASTDPVPASVSASDVPAPLATLLADCLHKDPQRRPSADVVAARLRELIDEGSARRPGQESPFPGLLPFSERRASVFFGRDGEITAFLERLRQQPVVPVVGPSGAGKSSFAGAGVVARLREQRAWTILEMRPGATPFRTLAERLLAGESSEPAASPVSSTEAQPVFGAGSGGGSWPVVARTSRRSEATGAGWPLPPEPPEPSAPAPDRADRLAAQLADQPGALGQHLRQMAEDGRCHVLLLVDQVEELSTLTEDEEVRRRFLGALCAAADDEHDPVRVVFLMRDDFLGRLATTPTIRDVLGRSFVLRAPGPEALAETIERPLAAVGYRVDDPTLVPEMIAAVSGEPGCLPLLQFTARMLWERRDGAARTVTRAAYGAIGGVGGALAEHADGVLAGLAPAQIAQARELLLRLVTPERARRVVPEEQLLDGQPASAADVLARLVRARLVAVRRGGRDGGEAHVELAHESLVHNWGQLARWIDATREDHAFLAEVGQAAELWERRGQAPEEVWRGAALDDAVRALERCASPVPDGVRAFIGAGVRLAERSQRRRRLVIAAGVAALLVVAIVATITSVVIADQERRARAQQAVAEQERRIAEQHRLTAEQRRAEAEREGARSAWSRGDLVEARAKLRASLELADSPEARGLWWTLRENPLLWRRTFGANVNAVEFSPDGERLAVACSDTAAYLVDPVTGSSRPLRGHRDQVVAAAFSPDGRSITTGALDGEVRRWGLDGAGEPDGRSSVVVPGGGSAVRAVAYGPLPADAPPSPPAGDADPGGAPPPPRPTPLAVGLADGRVAIVAPSGEQQAIGGPGPPVRGLAWHPRGSRLAAAYGDGAVRVWDPTTGALLQTLVAGRDPAAAVAYAPDGSALAAGALDGSVRLWDGETGAPRPSPAGSPRSVLAVAFSPDGARLATGGSMGTVVLWDAATGRRVARVGGQRGRVLGLAFDPRAPRLAIAANDHTLSMVDIAAPRLTTRPGPHDEPVFGVAISPDGRTVASASFDGTVRLWDARTGRQRTEVLRHTNRATVAAFSPDGALLATGGSSGDIRLWDAHTARDLGMLAGHSEYVASLRFRADGAELLSGAFHGAAIRWDVRTATALTVWQAHDGDLSDMVYAPDGIATAGFDGSVRLWEPDGTLRRELRAPSSDGIYGLAVDGGYLLAGTGRGEVIRIDPETGETQTLFTTEGRVFWLDADGAGGLALPLSTGEALLVRGDTGGRRGGEVGLPPSPGGDRSPTGAKTLADRLSQPRVGEGSGPPPPLRLRGHRGEVNMARFSRDGTWVATTGDDGTVRTWDAATGRPRWHTAGLLAASPRMWSQRGWHDPGETKTRPAPDAPWRRAVEGASLLAEAGGTLCVAPADGGLSRFPPPGAPPTPRHAEVAGADRRAPPGAVEGEWPGGAGGAGAGGLAGPVDELVVAAGRCAALVGDQVMVLGDEGEPLPFAGGVTALGAAGDDLLVATGDTAQRVSPGGETHQRWTIQPGATAVAARGDGGAEAWDLLVGYATGDVELTSAVGGGPRALEPLFASAVVRVMVGPADTVAAGLADGHVGLWSVRSGRLLAQARLHGPARHMRVDGTRLLVASELGDSTVLDLGVFQQDRCSLLRDVWDAVPVAWDNGQAVRRGPPAEHLCR